MQATKQISAFFAKVEGNILQGYVPCWLVGTNKRKSKNYKGDENPELFLPMYSSGVTIGAGCDLGQTTVDYLIEYGVDNSIIRKLEPYIGKKKKPALLALHAAPLSLTSVEITQLNESVHEGYLEKFVIPGYNRDATKCSFENLPSAAQCCIASMCYQKGVGGVRKDFSNTWAALCRCDWKDAYNRLTNPSLWNDFVSRRKQEGQLLKGLF